MNQGQVYGSTAGLAIVDGQGRTALTTMTAVTDDPAEQRTPELDVESLHKLANVVRFRAYLALRAFGPMRARRVAQLTGISQTSMNRHLEILREVGFVAAEETGPTRQTWVWSAIYGGVRVGRIEGGDLQDAALEWLQAVIDAHAINAAQWARVASTWPQAWQSAAETQDWLLHLTSGELEQMAGELRSVAEKWREHSRANEGKEQAPDSTPADPNRREPVVLVIQAVPYPRELP